MEFPVQSWCHNNTSQANISMHLLRQKNYRKEEDKNMNAVRIQSLPSQIQDDIYNNTEQENHILNS